MILQNKEFTFRGHGGSVDQLCWHASNSDLLSTASGDKSVRIWDARSQKCAAHIVTKGRVLDGNIVTLWEVYVYQASQQRNP